MRSCKCTSQGGEWRFVLCGSQQLQGAITAISPSRMHWGLTGSQGPGCRQVKKEGCHQFEETWKNRESRLKDTPGFVRFALLKGDEEGGSSRAVVF